MHSPRTTSRCPAARPWRRRDTAPAVAQHAHPGHDLVLPVGRQGALGAHQAQHVGHVAGEQEAGMGRHARGRIGHAHNVHAVVVHHLAGLGQFAVAARVGGHVDHDGTLGHPVHHGLGEEDRGGAPGHGGRGDDHEIGQADFGAPGRVALACQQSFVGQPRGRTPPVPLGRHAQVQEGGAQALCFLLGRGAHVIGLDHGAQPSRRGDRLVQRAATPTPITSTPWPGGRYRPPS